MSEYSKWGIRGTYYQKTNILVNENVLSYKRIWEIKLDMCSVKY